MVFLNLERPPEKSQLTEAHDYLTGLRYNIAQVAPNEYRSGSAIYVEIFSERIQFHANGELSDLETAALGNELARIFGAVSFSSNHPGSEERDKKRYDLHLEYKRFDNDVD